MDLLIDLDKKTKVLLEYMLICKRGFDLANVLQEINEQDLGVLEEIEKEDLRTYLTAGNKDIPQEQVIDHILSTYSELKDYTNLEGPLSVLQYRNIADNLENTIFKFHINYIDTYVKKVIDKRLPFDTGIDYSCKKGETFTIIENLYDFEYQFDEELKNKCFKQ